MGLENTKTVLGIITRTEFGMEFYIRKDKLLIPIPKAEFIHFLLMGFFLFILLQEERKIYSDSNIFQWKCEQLSHTASAVAA